MELKFLTDVKPPYKKSYPQCCVTVTDYSQHSIEWRKKRLKLKPDGWVWYRCQKYATVIIEGKHYCRPHAGQRALTILDMLNKRGVI